MSADIIIPHVGETTTRVRILRWLKAEGQLVKKGEPLLEVETDKAILEIEAYADGILDRIIVPEGGEADAMEVVGRLRSSSEPPLTRGEVKQEPGPQVPPAREPVNAPTAPAVSGERRAISPLARRVAAELKVDLDRVPAGPGGRVAEADVRQFAAGRSRVVASPKARRLAADLGVELAGLTGTGTDGLVVAADVQAAAVRQAAPAYSEAQPIPRLRQVIAARMLASKQSVPHFYIMMDVDMTQVQHLRRYCQEQPGWERPPTYTDIVVRACGLALAAMPAANVSLTGRGLIRHESVNIGLAVSLEEGLIVPVLPSVDRLSLRQLSAMARELIDRTRQNRLREIDLAPKSMVVSNLGMYGVDAFIAIIDPPDPMILAVGQVAERIVPVAGQPAIRPMCTLTLSADHRVLDGVLGAQFLGRVKAILENPFEIIGG